MNRFATTSCTALVLAGSAHAGLVNWDLTGTGTGTGALASLGTVSMKLTMTFDDTASALSGATAVGAWSFELSDSSGGSLFTTAGAASLSNPNSATYTRWTSGGVSTRRYTIVLGGATSSAWQGVAAGLPSINLAEVGFVAARSGTTYGTFADSLTQSATAGTGFIMLVSNGTAASFGTISAAFAVPAPGAASLLAIAGLVSLRRRRA